ncbi:MAG: hypothetical protein ABFD63_11160 [Smithella sp.]|jgi:hypothetical protein
MEKVGIRFVLVISVLLVVACGGLRFSQLDSEATDYHPRKVAVFPVSVGSYEEARNPLEQIVPAELTAKKWFSDVIDTASLNSQIQSNDELRQAVTDYISKLNTLNYSDPALSEKIGQLIGADAFLFITLEEWRYTVEKEKNYAKASIGFKLIDPATGKIMWRAAHNKTERYVLVKPNMSRIARSVIIDLISKMPH